MIGPRLNGVLSRSQALNSITLSAKSANQSPRSRILVLIRRCSISQSAGTPTIPMLAQIANQARILLAR